MGTIGRPGADDYAPYYAHYVGLVKGDDVLTVLACGRKEIEAVLSGVPPERERDRYAAGKWSIREVAGHVIDAERAFAFRALTFARGDAGPLPGMEQEPWVASAGHDDVPLGELVTEFGVVRAATIALLRHLPPEAWARRGLASGHQVTVRALAFIIGGHAEHHLAVLVERYGVTR